MLLASKWLEYIEEEYGSIDNCDDAEAIGNIRSECVAWFYIHDRVVKSFNTDSDEEVIMVYSNLIKNDRKIMTHLFEITNSWMKKRNLYEYIN